MKDVYKILVRPVITEKTDIQKEKNNQITFEISRDANKIEVKEAVEKLLKVKVLKVNTVNIEGKPKRLGRNTGKKRDWKKAIVTLKEGDYIDFFEGV